MKKILRSFVQEQFDLDTRIKLDLLMRRRDLINEEKPEELLKILRAGNIDDDDIVLLGPGTNRYAIKLNGFVVKFAMDHDGVIDNYKEFKMTKRLYPRMSKTHEVSQNGDILIAEYIPPFQSYTEMCQYADKIRESLKEISSVYLLGDVGITPKNYSNWGIRIGTDDPVCYDYAYVYDVSSDLFVCTECGSMLVPDKDYVKLVCSNASCGRTVEFETLRGRISNEQHLKEIGDLAEEGYLLYESHVDTELTESRSNYLANQKKETKKIWVPSSYGEVDPFVMEHSPQYYIDKENRIMTNAESVVKTVMANQEKREPMRKARTVQAISVRKEQPSKPASVKKAGENVQTTPQESKRRPRVRTVVAQKKETVEPAETVSSSSPVDDKIKTRSTEFTHITPKFINELQQAISKFSYRISSTTEQMNLFIQIAPFLRDRRMGEENFYKSLTKCIFRSLITFCDFEEKQVKEEDGGTKIIFIPPTVEEIKGSCYEDTVKFIKVFWSDMNISTLTDSILALSTYHTLYRNDPIQGIQDEWLDFLKERLDNRFHMDNEGTEVILRMIAIMWCNQQDSYEASIIEAINENFHITDIPDKTNILLAKRNLFQDIDTARVIGVLKMKEYPDAVITHTYEVKCSMYLPYYVQWIVDDEEIARNSFISMKELYEYLAKTDEEQEINELMKYYVQIDPEKVPYLDTMIDHQYATEEPDEETLDEEEEVPTKFLSVMIYPENQFDVIHIDSCEVFGDISIPLYVDGGIDQYQIPNLVRFKENGSWDWLTTMVPDIMFSTKTPEEYLEVNDYDPEEEQIKIVILDKNEDVYTMGIYCVQGVYIVEEGEIPAFTPDPDLLKQLNGIIMDAIYNTSLDHHKRSFSMKDLIHPEDYIKTMLTFEMDNLNEEESELKPIEIIDTAEPGGVIPEQLIPDKLNEETTMTQDEMEEAAIHAMMAQFTDQIQSDSNIVKDGKVYTRVTTKTKPVWTPPADTVPQEVIPDPDEPMETFDEEVSDEPVDVIEEVDTLPVPPEPEKKIVEETVEEVEVIESQPEDSPVDANGFLKPVHRTV